MTRRKIAIIGSCHPDRARDLGLKDVDEASSAAQKIGWMLAECGYDIVVYSSMEGMLEVDVAKGYASYEEAQPGSIRVTYSRKTDPEYIPNFSPIVARKDLLRDDANNYDKWETAFYRSIADVDGVVLLGGGDSTLIAGLVAAGHRKPILILAKFGGAAENLWEILQNKSEYNIPKEDWDLMIDRNWTDNRAKELINLLTRQCDNAMRVKEARAAEIEELQRLRIMEENKVQGWKNQHTLAVIISLALVMLGVLFVLGIQELTQLGAYFILLLVPCLGGVLGSAALALYNYAFVEKERQKRRSLSENVTLGLIVGGISGLLFIAAQVSTLSTLDLTADEIARQLRPLVMFAAVLSILSGLTLEGTLNRFINTSAQKLLEENRNVVAIDDKKQT